MPNAQKMSTRQHRSSRPEVPLKIFRRPSVIEPSFIKVVDWGPLVLLKKDCEGLRHRCILWKFRLGFQKPFFIEQLIVFCGNILVKSLYPT